MKECNLEQAVKIFHLMQAGNEIIETARMMAPDLKVVFQHPGVGTTKEGYGTIPAYAAMLLEGEAVRSRVFDLLIDMVQEKQFQYKRELEILGLKLNEPLTPPMKQIENLPSKPLKNKPLQIHDGGKNASSS